MAKTCRELMDGAWGILGELGIRDAEVSSVDASVHSASATVRVRFEVFNRALAGKLVKKRQSAEGFLLSHQLDHVTLQAFVYEGSYGAREQIVEIPAVANSPTK